MTLTGVGKGWYLDRDETVLVRCDVMQSEEQPELPNRIRYDAVVRLNGKVMFDWHDLTIGSAPNIHDDDWFALGQALFYASLAPGDTDPDFFDNYTPEQLVFVEQWGNDLSIIAESVEKHARAFKDSSGNEPVPQYAIGDAVELTADACVYYGDKWCGVPLWITSVDTSCDVPVYRIENYFTKPAFFEFDLVRSGEVRLCSA